MAIDGDGNREDSGGPPIPEADSIDALLAELLGPDFDANEPDSADKAVPEPPGTPDSNGTHDSQPAEGGEDSGATDSAKQNEPAAIADEPSDSTVEVAPAEELTPEAVKPDLESSTESASDTVEPVATPAADVTPPGISTPDVSPPGISTPGVTPPGISTPGIIERTAEAIPDTDQPNTVPSSDVIGSMPPAAQKRPDPSVPIPVSTPQTAPRTKPKAASGATAGRPRIAQRTTILVVAGIGLLALLIGAWGIDTAGHRSAVVRGVAIEDTPVSGMQADELRQFLDAKQQDLAAEPVVIRVGETTITTDPVTLGASIDSDEIVAEAFNVGRSGFFVFRPLAWLGRLVSGKDLPIQYQYDVEATAGAADSVIAAALGQPQEPQLVVDDNGQMAVEPGSSGTTIDPRELVGRLPSVIEGQQPYQIDLQAIGADPEIDEQALGMVAAEINEATAEPVRIQILDETTDIAPAMLKSWALPVTTDGDLTWTIDHEKVLSDLQPRFPALGSEDQRARFTVVNDRPVIVPAAETVVCCDEDSLATIRSTLAEPIPGVGSDDTSDDDTPARTIVLKPTTVGFDEGVVELESLGIIEEVSTFTTEHPCCQNRVKNIQRFADLMQGVIIRPGETFSLNGHVGRRTIENGFVADGAIILGVIEPQVGGGISQYATTFFNASFFAGIEFLEYQSHSLYISRYPRGREATISWRQPDLVVRNNTPYGILVWNEYTPTSITVTFYSTKHLEVENLPLRRSSRAQCRVDTTPRVITYSDGTQAEDSVQALYRPGEGLDCNGDSTRPDEDDVDASTTTTTAAATETTGDTTTDSISPTTDSTSPTTGSTVTGPTAPQTTSSTTEPDPDSPTTDPGGG